MIKLKPYIYQLSLSKHKIQSIFDFESNQEISKFSSPVTDDHYKIYILKSDDKFLYIGATKSPIRNRLRFGLSASGENGYHGYKWKGYKSVLLYVYCFEDFDKIKIESVEAELVFLVRKTTGLWPESQNEIHFNNNFVPTGQLVAEKIFRQVNKTTEKNHRQYGF